MCTFWVKSCVYLNVSGPLQTSSDKPKIKHLMRLLTVTPTKSQYSVKVTDKSFMQNLINAPYKITLYSADESNLPNPFITDRCNVKAPFKSTL